MRAIMILMVLLMAGCGFHLRGTGINAVDFSTVHVIATNAYGELQREVERTFVEAGVSLDEQAPYVVTLVTERATRRPIATGSSPEYELRLEVSFEVTDVAGETTIPLTRLAVERVYRFDTSSFVGSSEEEALLSEEMRRDIAGQILRRINATVRSNESTSQ